MTGTDVNAEPAALVDRVLASPVLVVGGLPPTGRDLDLLVGEGDRPALEDALRAAGFEGADGRWVRFGGLRAQEVELVPAASWGLERAELERMLVEAAPCPATSASAVPPRPTSCSCSPGASSASGLRWPPSIAIGSTERSRSIRARGRRRRGGLPAGA